ncbi:MAG: tRNA (adenosine(37)-N6)-dimethylallyltransferase MiaA [Opitutaceae bacterium]
MLHIITGPTAVGKTETALRYAEDHDAEIVSCDASLFYRGMDIGTAKPSREELARVPHHMIDICDVDEPYDIVQFDRDVRVVIESILSRGKAVVVTGGSGFYLKSFLAPVIDTVVVSDEVRAQVGVLYEEQGLEGLLSKLASYSADGIGNLDTKNPRRVLRALERCIASGKSLTQLQADFAARPEPYADFEKRLILLERDPDQLRERVALRAGLMIEQGLIDEVEGLKSRGIEKNPSAASAIGYRETLSFLSGELPQDELLPAIIQNTNHLVKKQRTWFRSQIREPDERIVF